MNRSQRRAAERRAAKLRPRLGPAVESPPPAAQPPSAARAVPAPASSPVSEVDLFVRLRRAAQRRAAADQELVDAMRQAREAGLSFARIGGAVEVSAQAVRQRLLRA